MLYPFWLHKSVLPLYCLNILVVEFFGDHSGRMEVLAAPTVTLPRAANAAGFSTRALRLAMAPPHPFELLGQPGRLARTRNRFAPVDVVRLAIARRLLDFGLTLAEAQHTLDRSVDNHVSGLIGCGVALPSKFLLDRLDGLFIHIARTGDALDVWTDRVGMRVDSPHDTVLTVDGGAVASVALATLNSRNPA